MSFPTLLDYLGETRWEGRPSPSTRNPALFYTVDDEGPILHHIFDFDGTSWATSVSVFAIPAVCKVFTDPEL